MGMFSADHWPVHRFLRDAKGNLAVDDLGCRLLHRRFYFEGGRSRPSGKDRDGVVRFCSCDRSHSPSVPVPGKVIGIFPTGYQNFVMGPIVYHTHFAAFIETILPISIFLTISESKKSYTYLGISAVLFTAVVVSASRGGLVIVSAEIICVLVLSHLGSPGAGRKIRFRALGLVGVMAVLACVVGFATVWRRFYAEAWMLGRIQFAVSTLHMIAVHPWIGWGLGCWPAAYPAFATFDPGAIVNQAHCDWLQWTAEGGVPVGLAMLSLAVWAIRPAIRTIWGIGVIAVLIHAGFDYPFSRPAVGAWPILMLSMAAGTQGLSRAHGR